MSENPVIRKSYNIMEDVVTELGREIIRQANEIDVLTTERDDALQRIEKLERRLDLAWNGGRAVEIILPESRGGVHPNA